MKAMSLPARIYIWAVLVAGSALLLGTLPWLLAIQNEWLIFAVLTLCSATAQLFPVVSPKSQAYYVTLVFLFPAVLLLSPFALAVLVVVTFIPEWIKVRYRWYIQLFNISTFIIAALAAKAVYTVLSPRQGDILDSLAGLLAMVLAASAFTFINHVLLAVVLHLVRGHSWKKTRLFELEYFLTDATLSCMGVILIPLWQASPWLVSLVGAPVFLIYRALSTAYLQEKARTDTKTGLYNAGHLSQVLREELARATRLNRSVAFIMADMDLLRNINNTYGHLAGDIVLQGVAAIIKNGLRENDLGARFGGEEFGMVLPDTEENEALAVAERIRKQVKDARFEVPTSEHPIKVTISLGVAVFPTHGRGPEEVMHQADLAVYYAKLLGRNRAWACSPESRALALTMVGRADQATPESPDEKIASATPAELRSQTAAPTGESSEGSDGAKPGARHPSEEDNLRPAPIVPITAVEQPSTDAAQTEQEPSSRALWRDPAWWVGILVGAVVAATVGLWALDRPWEAQLDWIGLAALALLTLGAQSQAIEIYGHGRISTSAIPIMAGCFLFGFPAALLLAPLVPLAVWVRRGGLLHRALFDVGDISLSAVVATSFYWWSYGHLPGSEPVALLLSAGVAAVAYYVLNVGLISTAIGLTEHRPILEVWLEKFSWLFLHYLAFGVLAALTTLAYTAIGLYGLLAFVVPTLLLRQGMKQYTDRTERHVSELKRVNHELRQTYDATLATLSAALDSRDSDTEGHSERVVQYTEAIARQMSVPEDQIPGLLNGALLHDVGKIGVPDAILTKRGPLTAEEWETMQMHSEVGYRMLLSVPFLHVALPLVRHHHEHYDGTGYPDGLRGDAIPLGARIFAVADAFDAITSDRSYRSASCVRDALDEIERCSGTQFDPQVVQALLRVNAETLSRISGQPVVERRRRASEIHPVPSTSEEPALVSTA